ncbi:MAG: ABC transporter permease subunit, partial [Beijerinckiaceae bacterium]
KGPVNTALLWLGLIDKPLLLGHSDFGIVIGMVHILLPIATLTLWSGISKIDPTLEIAGSAMGAGRVQTFTTIFLPLCTPALVAAGTLVYVLALGAYVIPATLGGTRGLMIAQLVVEQATQLLNWEVAGAMGAIILVAAGIPPVVLAAVHNLLKRRRPSPVSWWHSVVARTVHPVLDRIPVSVWRFAWQAAASLVLLFLIIPEIVVVAFSFGPLKAIQFPPTEFTLEGYRQVFASSAWTSAFERSLTYALIDAVLAVALGTLAAYGFARGNALMRRLGMLILLAPVVLPEIITAIGYFIFASQHRLAGTDAGIIIGQAINTVGLVVVVMSPIVNQIDINLEYAAQSCGASRRRVLLDVVRPLIAPGMIVGFVYGFLHAFDNLVTPLFIAGTKATIPVRMFQTMQEELTSAPAVVASVLIAALVAGMALFLVLAQRSKAFANAVGMPVASGEKT